jgi:RNA polymerase sigma-70 factor (ECF subfamily)
LRPFLTHPPSSADYESLSARLAEPRNRIAVALHRLSRRYGELIRAEVADTVNDPMQVDSELRRLIEVIAH